MTFSECYCLDLCRLLGVIGKCSQGDVVNDEAAITCRAIAAFGGRFQLGVNLLSPYMFRVSSKVSYHHHILEPKPFTARPTSKLQSDTKLFDN